MPQDAPSALLDEAVLSTAAHTRGGRVGVGVDLVCISRMQESLDRLGPAFLRRIFTPDEVRYAQAAPALATERLAARFAAKEAALKALDLATVGVDWRDIEVRRRDDGATTLAFHGRTARRLADRGIQDVALSLSHEGDYAAAVVTAFKLPEPISED